MGNNNRLLREHTSSSVRLNTGPRGAGKSMLMAWMIALALITCEWINNLYAPLIGTKIFKKPLRVWSNLPISFMYQASQDGAIWPGANIPKLLQTLALNMHKLYAFDDEMQWGRVFIDELDQHADRQDWQNGGQKLLMKILVQVRKLHLSLTATVQSLNWINPRFMFQIDTTTGCRDAAVTGWGQANDIEPGTLIFTYTQDRSGRETGYTFEESGETYQAQLYGLPLQGLYDTDFVLNPWEHYESIKIARKQYVLDPNAKEEIEMYQGDVAILESTLAEYVQNGIKKIERPEFFRAAQAKGLTMNKTEAFSYMEDVHNVKKYNSQGYVWLDLTEVKNLQKQSKGQRKPKEKEEAEV
jgi:hypothetical protein